MSPWPAPDPNSWVILRREMDRGLRWETRRRSDLLFFTSEDAVYDEHFFRAR